MEWICELVGGAVSGLLQGFLALFGMSDAQKLGRAEVKLSDQAETIKEITDGKAIETQVLNEPAGAASDWLHQHVPKE